MSDITTPAFKAGDRVRLRVRPDVTGVVMGTPGECGEINVDWTSPFAILDCGRLPEELEHNRPPLTAGMVVLVPCTVETAEPDHDGNILVRAGATGTYPRGASIYVPHAVAYLLNRVEQ